MSAETQEIIPTTTSNNGNYGADSIQVLEGLEAVRNRPAMYIGDIGEKGLHLLFGLGVDTLAEPVISNVTHHRITMKRTGAFGWCHHQPERGEIFV